MLSKKDVENHIEHHKGRLTEEFISQLSGVKKINLNTTTNRLIKKEIINCNELISARIGKNGAVNEILERGYNLIDAMLILSRFRNNKSIQSFKLCKDLLHA